jgi:pyruvate/2-oxoglutarate dehydrogenase complex dihydrolipoamide dehydrogenase (E3) component
VEVVPGTASLADAHTVVVRREGQPERRLTSDYILVATGSVPYRPPLYPFGDPRVHDSDELLDLVELPRAMVVVGAGVVGSEYACMFAALGIPVTLVDLKPELLPFLDDEFSALLRQRMEALGVTMRLGVRHAFGRSQALAPVLPYGIYTIPGVSMAGETEEALRAQGVPYVAGRAPFLTNPRGQIIGETHGLLKLLFHRESLKLLGVHVLGEQASELVHIGLTALVAGAGAQLFVETCFNYPTLSEAYKAATYDALQQLSGTA